MRKKLQVIGEFCLILLVTVGPMAAVLGLQAYSGSAGDTQSLAVLSNFSPRIFKCEWTDGRQALMASVDGYRRLIDLQGQLVAVGKSYGVKVRTVMRGKFPGYLPPRLVEL